MIEWCEEVDGKRLQEERRRQEDKKRYEDIPEPTDFRPLGYEW